MKYRVKENITLNGKPAGPDRDDNFVAFLPGDLVELAGYDTVMAVRLSDGLDQIIDFDSLGPLP